MAFTFFFRDLQSLDMISQHVLPVVTGRRHMRIWDAGCAHGPEPYSIAILLRGHMSHFLFRNVQITATDINDKFGDIIKSGVYPEAEIKRVPTNIQKKYFARIEGNGHFRISDEILSRVDFIHHDLLNLQPPRTDYNLIVCKNVLLHFSPAQREEVLRMFHSALCEDGFLLTEQTQALPTAIEPLFRRLNTHSNLFQKFVDS